MNRAKMGILMSLVLVASVAMAQTSTPSIPVTVDCSKGQSLNGTLSQLDKHTPFTVSVNGTCSEYVHVVGFENLTLKGQPGATLLQPTTGAGTLLNSVLLIESSKSITVSGFNVAADVSTLAIAIGHGSSDVRLRNLKVQGGSEGILVFENSQVSIAYVTAQDPGYTPLGVYDASDVHVEHCLFESSTGAPWHVGMDVGASHVTVSGTIIRNMQVGVNVRGGGIVDVAQGNTYFPLGGQSDVVIESPAGTNYDGVSVEGSGSLNVLGAKLVIKNPGQSWGGTTAGVLVSDGATMNTTNGNLVITSSRGQGIVVQNNSHATLIGATVTGSGHGGLVLANLSTIDVSAGPDFTLVGGNSVDLFCDSGSTITGSVNLAGVPTSKCINLLAGETVTLP